VATPTGDPVNMMLLAAPIMLLVGAAILFCLLNDRRRRRLQKAEPDYENWDDDALSPLPADDEDAPRR
jgi:sec-independent protein translocase protein TatC